MKSFVPLALLASSAFAKTDLEGCTSFTSKVTVRPEPGYGNTYDTVIWYVSDTLEICAGVDCGGGRAPPKSVPGCPLYEGTETVTPKFLDEDPMKATEAPESSIATATAPETSAEAVETETTSVASATETETETETVGTATASESSETRGIATATAPDTSTITTMVTSSAATSPATTGEAESTSEGGDDEEASATSETNTPGAAMPTAAVALNVVAGVAAAVAFL